MKIIKGVTTFLVLCLAAYGAFTLYTNLTKPPKVDLTGDDVNYLKSIGIEVQGDGRASASGINTMINMEGVAPVGAEIGTSSSVALPAVFGGQVAPSFTAAAPPYAAESPAPSSAPAFPGPAPPAEVLPRQNISEPAGFPPPPTSFQALPPIAPRSVTQPVPATESPPPWNENWDGPASNISALSPPSERLHSSIPPSPNTHTQPSSDIKTASPFDGGSVRRIEPGSVKQGLAFAATENVPMDSVPPRYTQTAARQPLAFEPAKPESATNTPFVAFAPPKQTVSSPQHPIESSGDSSAPIAAVAAAAAAPPTTVPETVERFIQSQRQLIETGVPENIRQAYIQLSRLYEHKQLSSAERGMLRPLLDTLALKVIYSKDSHILESPYRVKPGETIESIAKDYNLNPVFLRKINGLAVPRELAPGTTLKVVYGQFDARISIKQKELTLLLGGLYAGQFSFAFPNTEIPVRSGEFFVAHRSDQMVALNNGWKLATPHMKDATIVFADQDAQDIFDILSEQSVIVVE